MKKWFEGFKFDISESLYLTRGDSFWNRLMGVLWVVGHWSYFFRMRCKIFGHRWESEDYGNENSGYMGVRCDWCGESHGTTLY